MGEGWQGDPDDPGGQTKTWWVSPVHANQGLFRWVVYGGRGGQAIATSQPFTLPGVSETRVIEVVLPAE